MSILRGRFAGEIDDRMRHFSSSLSLDLKLAHDDILGSIAHAEMLGATGIITETDASTLVKGLRQVARELENGAWVPDDQQEDIHMAVEAHLTELVGEVAGVLHSARSRNDQVATAVRLWLKRQLVRIDSLLADLTVVLIGRVERDGEILIPGYTHLQRGQPILLGHHLLAHIWALQRDRERFDHVKTRVDCSPLGACAMAGTPHPIDREFTARRLGFSAVAENAMDAVSAHDHLQEVAADCAILMSHLSRMAAELVLWSSAEFSFVRLAEGFATGSSIMPQKRNPDAAELVRGKAGRVFAALQALLVIPSGLPLAYNRDLQEDRAPLFEAVEETERCLEIMALVWSSLDLECDRFETELYGDFCLATEIADLLVELGTPFREAHEIVGKMVKWCEQQDGNLSLLDHGVAQRWVSNLPHDLEPWLNPRNAAERRTSFGGSAWSEIQRQVMQLKKD